MGEPTDLKAAPKSLLQYQQEYSRYLRAFPKQNLPTGIPERRSQIYESLLFNNVCGFVNKCFPVAKNLLPQDQWDILSRAFFEQWQCHTPIFSQIPYEFVQFNAEHTTQLDAPPWLPELLHYEWLELKVDLDVNSVDECELKADEQNKVITNPTLQLQQYSWPVHQLSPNNIPLTPQSVFLCVYRTPDLRVKFMEINAVTAILLELLQNTAHPPASALDQLALHLPQLNPQQVHHFGRELIEQLVNSNVLLVVA